MRQTFSLVGSSSPHLIVLAAFMIAVATPVAAQQPPPAPASLAEYLTDVTPGAVSAGELVGLSKSAISQIQSSQDLVLALKPFSTDDSRAGFGLAITPARSGIISQALISSSDYATKPYLRPLAALTLSYAENKADVAGTPYRKSGFSVDTSYYLNEKHDPVIIGQQAFRDCKERAAPELRRHEAGIARSKARLADELALSQIQQAEEALRRATTPDAKAKAEKELAAAKSAKDSAQRELDIAEATIKQARVDYNAANKKCIDDATGQTPWNASRVSASIGAAWINREDGGGGKESLGRALTLTGVKDFGTKGAGYLALRRTWHEVDLTTLTTSPAYKSSSLVAARIAYGNDDNGKVKMLAEISNAKKSEPTEANRVFKYALGLDAKLMKGVWMEFRLGKNQKTDGTGTETTSLLTVNWTPSASLFSK